MHLNNLVDVINRVFTSILNRDIIMLYMRTTINLDDDVVPLVKRYAEGRSLGLGKAVSELVRRGIGASLPTRSLNGLIVFDLPADSPRIKTETVRQLEAEE
jgi:hypothetical protein